MKKIPNKLIQTAAGFALVLSTVFPVQLHAGGGPKETAVTGYIDFSIVPANLGPYTIQGTDGDLYVRHLPLVGKFTLNGRGIKLDAKVHVDFSAEFDITGTGVAWFPVTITTTLNGVKTLIFEGQGNASEVSLVSVGNVSLKGRGPYEGMNLEFRFEEIGPGDSNTYNYKGVLMPGPQH